MRRSIIPVSTIQRIISANNRRKREAYNNYLISSNMGDMKELPPHYDLEDFEFNIETRIAKIVFLEIKEYRTIERYITQNYIKHPIYSKWKSKTKRIHKAVKLTNCQLESLNKHEDSLIREFAYEIVIRLNNEELFPSWFIMDFLKKEYDETVADINNTFKRFREENQNQIKTINATINRNLEFIEFEKEEQQILLKNLSKIKTKISKVEKAKKSIFLSIITLGIWGYYISNRRRNSLHQKQVVLEEEFHRMQYKVSQLKKESSDLLSQKNTMQELIDRKRKDMIPLLSKAKLTYESKVSQVKPLATSYDYDNSFILLKTLIGFEYKKIIGCYIIHNREKNKYYVGQSKDVLKRLKQHFRGTVPHNIIFAEDYYSSRFEKKEDLFEVKIIPCNSKDELDKTEKDLIEKYDAWISGYNGTSGNN